MPVLHLPACPICGAKDSLVRQVLDKTTRTRSAYACWECGSVLAWLGDDLWAQSDRWAYQHVGREDKRHLLHRPLRVDELHQLADSVPRADPTPRDMDIPPRTVQFETILPGDVAEDEDVVLEPPYRVSSPSTDYARRPPAGEAQRGGLTAEGFRMDGGDPTALVPLAQILPEGLTLALVQYQGSRVVPVAVFEEGQLREVPTSRSRGRGSPLLIVSVGLTLLCLCCSATLLLFSSLLDGGGFPIALAPGLPASIASPVPTYTPVPTASLVPTYTPAPTDTLLPTNTPMSTDTPIPTDLLAQTPAALHTVVQGASDYVDSTGKHAIVGEVLNMSGSNLRSVEVLASFYDPDGQLIGTASTFVELDTIESGSRAPFKLNAQDIPPSFDSYELRIDYAITDQVPLRLEFPNHTATLNDTGAYLVVGEVRNPYDFAVKFPKIVATYYDSANQVRRVEMTLGEADTLEPGQISHFELLLADPPDGMSHYRLQTEAVRQ